MGWQAYTIPEYLVWFSRLCYKFVLTSVPLTEHPFLYDISGGYFKKIRLAMVVAVLSAASSLGFP